MTREEAIEELKCVLYSEYYDSLEFKMAMKMAIQALSQEPCDDAISRADALGQLYEWVIVGEYEYEYATEYLRRRIKALPSVTQKSGKWIRWREEIQHGTHYTENIPHCKCSECDKEYDIFASRFINFCPNCGARMESEE